MSGNARRLENDYRELREAFDGDPRVKVIPLGTAPFEKYRIAYIGVPSLRQNQGGQPMLVEQTVVDIELPAGYPKMPLIAKTAGGLGAEQVPLRGTRLQRSLGSGNKQKTFR